MMDENVINTKSSIAAFDQENNNDQTSSLVADGNDNVVTVGAEQVNEEVDFQSQHEQDDVVVGGGYSDGSLDSHSQVAQLEDSSFDATDPAFPDSDATNCTSSPVNGSLPEEMVNVTLYDNTSTHVEDILEEDNLHGLSIHPEVTTSNDENKEIQSKLSDVDSKRSGKINRDDVLDKSHQHVSSQHKPLDNGAFLHEQNSDEVCVENDKTSLNHLSRKDNKCTNVISQQNTGFEPELDTNDVLVGNCINSSNPLNSQNCNFHHKPIKSPETDKQVQSMIEKNLEKLSPKKSSSREATEAPALFVADTVCTPTTPSDRPKRFNPFNNIDCSDEHASVDLWQKRTAPTDNKPASDLQLPSNLKVNFDLYNHPLPSSLLQDQNSAHSSNERQRNWSDIPNNPDPCFDLMPSRFVKPQSNDGNAISDIDDVDAVVKEIKKQISSPSQPLDDPWVKVAPQEHENNIRGEAHLPILEPHYESREIELAEPQKQEVENSIPQQPTSLIRPLIEAAGPCEPADLIEGVIFAANYLGSTQLQSERNPGKNARMLQAQEAVNRIKAPEGESQPSVEVDLFISTDKVKILNADTQETMMDHTLRSISYIADIGKLLVIMAKRRSPRDENREEQQIMREPKPQRAYRVICHVFSSMDAHLMAQAIGQAFNVAYQQFLTANGIEPQTLTRDDYNQILDMQDMYHDDLVHYSKRENVKDLWVEKKKGENLGMVIVESGWGSIVPTVILANLQHGGPAERCGKLSIGDQIMNVNGTSLVGLPLTTCQSIIKGLKAQSIARLHVVSCPPVVTVLIKRPDLKYQLGFSVQDGIICSLMRGGIAERGGVRVGHRIIEINNQSVVAIPHEKIVQTLVSSVGEIQMKTMPAMMFRLLTGQEQPVYI